MISDQHEPGMKVRTQDEENVEDDYEEWKHRILENAHKLLGKTYKRN